MVKKVDIQEWNWTLVVKKLYIGSGSGFSQMKKWKIENIQFMQNIF